MHKAIIIITLILIIFSSAAGNEPEFTLDSNSAFYEGEQYNYVMSPPVGFRMVTYKAKFDGYSFAFVPAQQIYDSAQIMIGIHIYKIRGLTFEEALTSDTISINKHYGNSAKLRPIDPIPLQVGGSAQTFYFDTPIGFVPNVMISYYCGGAELIVYELVIQPSAQKLKAENQFVQAVGMFRALKRAELGQK